MRTQTCLLAFGIAAGACGTNLPAASIEVEAALLPKGAELVVGGEVVATREGSTLKFSMPQGKSLIAGSPQVRIATICGSIELPATFKEGMSTDLMSAEDEAAERSEKGPLKIRLLVDDLPRTQSVWVDAKPEVVKVGTQSLGPGESSLFVEGCDGAKRTITVDGEDVGPLPSFDLTKHHPSVVIVADKGACYEWQPVVYSQGGFMPNLHETLRLRDKNVYEVQFIHFFLTPPAKTVQGKQGGKETRYRFTKLPCDQLTPAEPAGK